MKAAGDAVVLEAGGFLDTPNQRIAVRHIPAVLAAADLKESVVEVRGGASIPLGQVADVTMGSPPPIGDSIINDVPGILLIVEKHPDSNTLELTRRVETALAELKPGLKDLEIDSSIFRPATFIERAIDNLTRALAIGCALVALILILFLFDWRTAVISLTAIPLSLVVALLVFTYSARPSTRWCWPAS